MGRQIGEEPPTSHLPTPMSKRFGYLMMRKSVLISKHTNSVSDSVHVANT